MPAILHGFHAARSSSEWLLPLLLVAGVGTALLARWIGRTLRGNPEDHDELV